MRRLAHCGSAASPTPECSSSRHVASGPQHTCTASPRTTSPPRSSTPKVGLPRVRVSKKKNTRIPGGRVGCGASAAPGSWGLGP
eukprot:2034474-Pyramimonas_sp.AAC.1